MFCCPTCFGDSALKKEIIPQRSKENGTCPTCGSMNQPLVDARELADYFELLLNIYVPDDDGKFLTDWLSDDWALFRNETVTPAVAKELLTEILDDGEIVRQKFNITDRCKTDNLESWRKLKDELMHVNRYFPDTSFDKDRLAIHLSNLILEANDYGGHWYRARIEKNGRPYGLDEMGAPPKKLASHGRANPVGIPYLYIASEISTAISEVRPHPREKICVAEFSINEDLKIVDLRDPRILISPFLLEDESDIALLRGDIDFLEMLGQELTTPVIPTDTAINYIPSQFLCEFIKKSGFDGVAYSSAMGTGINLALFNPDLAEATTIREYDVTQLNFDFIEINASVSQQD